MAGHKPFADLLARSRNPSAKLITNRSPAMTVLADPSGPHPLAGDPIEALTFGPLARDIDATLAERGNRYGDFAEHARITQNMKSAMVDSPNWSTLPADMREALEMVAHKVGRILNGDPAYHDSWHDIIGYTKLVADRLI